MQPRLTWLQKDVADGQSYMNAVLRYAAALEALSSSADANALTQRAGNVNASISALGSAIGGTFSNIRAAASATQGAGFLIDIFSVYLKKKRYQALQKSVHDADPLIKVVSNHLVGIFREVADARLQELGMAASPNRFSILDREGHRRIPAKEYGQELLALKPIVMQMHQIVTANPEAAARQLYKAHSALNASLQDKSKLEKLAPAIADFLKAAHDADRAFQLTTPAHS